MAVVVTVTRPAVTVTPTTSTSASATLSTGTIAGIIIGILLGGVLFIVLVLYLLDRYTRRRFSGTADPAHDRVFGPHGVPPTTSSRRRNFSSHHLQKPSISAEPLMSPISWSHVPSIPRVRSPGTPPRSDSISPSIRDSQYNIASGTVSHSAPPAILNIPPIRKSEDTYLPSDSSDASPPARSTSRDDVPSPSASPKLQSKLFLHRMLQSRAQASEGVSLPQRSSLDLSFGHSTTEDSPTVHPDEEYLLAEAERTALRDAGIAQRREEEVMQVEEDDWDVETTESIYSQISAPHDHSAFFSDPLSRRGSSSTVRRKSTRRQRVLPTPAELSSVVEMPDTPRAFEGRSDSDRVSAAGNSSPDGQVSHGTASRPMLSAIDQPGALPLLASANFGKSNTSSGTPPGSMSTTGTGGTSRYPSLAPSSILQSSRPEPRPDAETDWHHTPPGLAALTSLKIGSLQNPHSPVEELPEPNMLRPDPVQVKRAHLREGTVCSMPEVERRTVMQSGIAHIDVAL